MIVTSSSFELHPTGSFYGKIVRIEEDISKFDAKPQLVLTVETEPLYGEKKERSLLYLDIDELISPVQAGQRLCGR